MMVLIGCEESQEVCKAFRALGHEAYSCDIQECSGGHPEWHFQDDILDLIKPHPRLFITQNGDYHCVEKWDMMIAHPPCTYFSRAAGRWLYNPDRLVKTQESLKLVTALWDSGIERICIENPPGWLCTNWKRPNQKIHPWYFGDGEMKETCLWLRGLPRLNGDPKIAIDKRKYHPKPLSSRMGSDGKMKNKYFVSRVSTAKERSKTFPGIARAMAEQWGGKITQQL